MKNKAGMALLQIEFITGI